MKILISTFGSLGDLHPYLAIALEAKNRGHTPIFATSERYRAKIENLGFELRAVAPDWPDDDEFSQLAGRVMNARSGPKYLFRELISPHVRQSYADLCEAGADCDVILTHPAAPSGPLAATKLGKKWFSTALAPISLWSVYDPPAPPTFPALDILRVYGPIWGDFLKKSGRLWTRNWLREIEILRREEGLELRGHPIFEGQHSPFGTLALFSPRFAKPQKDWPHNTRAVGFCFYDANGYSSIAKSELGIAPEESESEAQFDIRNVPSAIVFTLGSSAVWNAGQFWEISADYAARLGKNAIFLTGKPTGIAWPSHVFELPYAPHSELFPRAELVVHQGGIGTTGQCLRAGVPQVVMPFAHDQPDNARRVENLGVGKSISQSRYARDNGEWALELLDDALENCKFAARRLGIKIREENGPREAVESFEF